MPGHFTNATGWRNRLQRLLGVATLAGLSMGCDTRGDKLNKSVQHMIDKAGDDKALAIEGVAKFVFITGFYSHATVVKPHGDGFVASVTMTRDDEDYLPSDMGSFRDGHARDRGLQILQTATLAAPLGLDALDVKIQVRATSAGLGLLDMLEYRCPVDTVLASVPSGADPFDSTMGGDAGEWTEATIALGPKAIAACDMVADHTGKYTVRETPT